jgi:hypothetical protein
VCCSPQPSPSLGVVFMCTARTFSQPSNIIAWAKRTRQTNGRARVVCLCVHAKNGIIRQNLCAIVYTRMHNAPMAPMSKCTGQHKYLNWGYWMAKIAAQAWKLRRWVCSSRQNICFWILRIEIRIYPMRKQSWGKKSGFNDISPGKIHFRKKFSILKRKLT